MFSTRIPETRAARWKLLDTIIECWFPTGEKASVSASEMREAERRLGRELPAALCEWYGSSGARADVWCVCDRLHPPDELRIEKGFLLFAVENQTCWYQGIPESELHRADPPVFLSSSDTATSWQLESDAVSRFALQYAMLNLKFAKGTSWNANALLTSSITTAVEASYPLLPFGALQAPVFPTRFHGDDELVIEVEGDAWMWATARTKPSLERLDELLRPLGIEWSDSSTL